MSKIEPFSENEIREKIYRYVRRYYADTRLAVKLGILSQQFGTMCRKSGVDLRELVVADQRYHVMTMESGALTAVPLEDVPS